MTYLKNGGPSDGAAARSACSFCLHLNYGRRFCSSCGGKLDVSHITNR